MALFLIIEPDEDIRQLYAAVVRGLGHEAAFLDDLPTPNPDVVLVEPAYRTSFEAALRLRHEHAGLPIVSASIDKATSGQAEALQPIAYLRKPFSLAELTDALRSALSQRGARSD
jgi:CheY-like chemotaxis protein